MGYTVLQRPSLLIGTTCCVLLGIFFLFHNSDGEKHVNTTGLSQVCVVSLLTSNELVDEALVLGYSLEHRVRIGQSLNIETTLLIKHHSVDWEAHIHRIRRAGWKHVVAVTEYDHRLLLSMKNCLKVMYIDLHATVVVGGSFVNFLKSHYFHGLRVSDSLGEIRLILMEGNAPEIPNNETKEPWIRNEYYHECYIGEAGILITGAGSGCGELNPTIPISPMWWDMYESLHSFELELWDRTMPPKLFTHVWLRRNTTKSTWIWRYHTLLSITNVTMDGLTLVPSSEGGTCNEACADRLQVCVDKALQWYGINSCGSLQRLFGIEVCPQCTYNPWGPGMIGSGTCGVNPLRIQNDVPLCQTKFPKITRACPCLPLDSDRQPKVFSHYSNFNVLVGASVVLTSLKASNVTDHVSFISPCDPARTNFSTEGDINCLAYISDANNLVELRALPSTNLFGRTVKMHMAFKDSTVRAIAKFPQGLFPLEAYGEIIGYELDRGLGLNYVPPTTFAFIPLCDIEAAAKSSAQGGAEYSKWISTELLAHALRSRIVVPDVETGRLVMLASVQLWLNDVNYQHHTDLAYSDSDGSYLNPEIVIPRKRDKIIAHLSDLHVFDAIMGNGDRMPMKNNYVAGGCMRLSCRKPARDTHIGTSSYVHIDQGRALYEREIPSTNLLHNSDNIEVGKGHGNPVFCRFRKSLIQNLKDMGSIVEWMRAKLPKYVFEAVGEKRFQWMEERRSTVLSRVQDCLSRYGETGVYSW
eukprot:PhF_6_TR43095/c0_g1_i1/m.65827